MNCNKCQWSGNKALLEIFCPECFSHLIPPVAGKRVGPYRLDRIIGTGGFAEVWLGTHIQLNTQRALKRLRIGELLKTIDRKFVEEFIQRFFREARIQAQLIHPNIVQVYELAKWEGEEWMVMEYCPSGSLKDYILENTLQIDEIVTIIESILDGLEYAHTHGVIHRDMKPSNILLGKDGLWKITDFGIAQVVDNLELTKMGVQLGTPFYMAPEQWRAEKNITGTSDIYAMGCILYYLVSKNHPFTGKSLSEIMEHHLFQDPPPIDSIPTWLWKVILKALKKDPASRFRTAGEMRERLKKSHAFQTSTLNVIQSQNEIHVKNIHIPQRHSSWVTDCEFLQDKFLISVSHDWSAILYNVEDGAITKIFKNFEGPIFKIEKHEQKNLIIFGEMVGRFIIFDANTMEKKAKFKTTVPLTSMSISHSGKYLLSGHFHGDVFLWSLDFYVSAFHIKDTKTEIIDVWFSSDDRSFFALDQSGRLCEYEVSTGHIKKEYELTTEKIKSSLYNSAKNRILYYTEHDGIVHQSISNIKNKVTFPEIHKEITSFSFYPNTDYLFAGTSTGSLLIMDALSGSMLEQLEIHDGAILTIQTSADGEYIATGGVDNKIYLHTVSFDSSNENKKVSRLRVI